jgi:AraC family transcriptional regulator
MSTMRPASRDRYIDRIGRVRAHIHAHLDDPLDLDALADVACLSRFHWHRVYRAMTGETAAQTVRRLRLMRAAHDLANPGLSLTDVAERAGYTTQAAFGRAFSAAYGLPPATFRISGQHAELVRAKTEENAMAFPVELRTLPVRPALGMVHKGPYNEIGRTFDKLFTTVQAEGLIGHVRGMFGRYVDDPQVVPAEDLKSHACIFVDSDSVVAKRLESFPAGGGLYAVLVYKGPYAAMQPAYDWLFGTWLPQSDREARDAPLLEVYLNTPMDTGPADLLTEICLPVEG